MTLTQNILLGSETRLLRIQAQAYNVFNHTEISGINLTINFNSITNPVTNLSSLGYVNAASGPSGAGNNRITAFTARLEF